MVSKKKTISSYKGTMNNRTHFSSSDSEIASKVKKNRRYTFENKIKCVVIITQDDALLNNRPKIPAFVIRPLKNMLNFEVDR